MDGKEKVKKGKENVKLRSLINCFLCILYGFRAHLRVQGGGLFWNCQIYLPTFVNYDF